MRKGTDIRQTALTDATAAIPVGSVTRLAEMSSKQELVALLHSEGCYHDWNAEVRFTRHAEGIQVRRGL